MNVKPLYFYILIFLFFISCNNPRLDWGELSLYFPEPELLQKGVVNKHYYHYKSLDGFEVKTDISYTKYQAEAPDILHVEYYDAGLDINRYEKIKIQDNKFLLEEGYKMIRGDTLSVKVIKNEIYNWEKDTSFFESEYKSEFYHNRYVRSKRVFEKDTIIENRPAKIFYKTSDVINDFEVDHKRDTTETHWDYREVYVSDFGRWGYEGLGDDGKIKLELVEQMSLSEFEKRQQNNIRRISEFPQEEFLDQNTNFELCEKENNIFDYYNGKDPAGIIGDKKSMWAIFAESPLPEGTENEEGYLTFRFVINCHGKAGRFVVQTADLNYQETEFSDTLVQYFYQIIKEIDTWKPCFIKKEPKDSYFYITLKINDGRITEILP